MFKSAFISFLSKVSDIKKSDGKLSSLESFSHDVDLCISDPAEEEYLSTLTGTNDTTPSNNDGSFVIINDNLSNVGEEDGEIEIQLRNGSTSTCLKIPREISYSDLVKHTRLEEGNLLLNNVHEAITCDDDVEEMILKFELLPKDKRILKVINQFPLALNLKLGNRLENNQTIISEKSEADFSREDLQSFERFGQACRSKLDLESTKDFICEYKFNDISIIVNEDKDVEVMIRRLAAMRKKDRIVLLKIYTEPRKVIMLLAECEKNNIEILGDGGRSSGGGDALIFKVTTGTSITVVRVLHNTNFKDAMEEGKIAIIKSDFLVNFNRVLLFENKVYYFMEYFENGTLLQKRKFSNHMLLDISKQLLKGIKALHDLEKIHCDISPCNVFIKSLQGEKIEIVLGDFGRVIENTGDSVSFRGKHSYSSGTGNHSKAEDLYSFAATMFYVATNIVPNTKEYKLVETKLKYLEQAKVSPVLIDFFHNIFVNYLTLTVDNLLNILDGITLDSE